MYRTRPCKERSLEESNMRTENTNKMPLIDATTTTRKPKPSSLSTTCLAPPSLSGALSRPLRPPLGSDVQVQRPNKLELGVILNSLKPFPSELVPVHQLAQQDLDLEQRKVESDARSRTSSEGHVSTAVARLDLLRVPSIGVEAEGIMPVLRVGVDRVQRRDYDDVLGQPEATGQNDVRLGRAAGLERGVVQTLGFLEEGVEEGQRVSEVGVPVCLVVDAKVDQLLQQPLLHLGVGHDAVDAPGQKGGGGGVAGAGHDEHVGQNQALGEVLALLVDGVDEEIGYARGLGRCLVQRQVLDAGRGRLLDGFRQLAVCDPADFLQLGRVAEGEVLVPPAAGSHLFVKRQHVDDVGDQGMDGRVDGVKVVVVKTESKLADGLRRKLDHVLVHVPGLAAGVELVKHLERPAHAVLHEGSVMPNSLGAERRREELVRKSPVLGLGVADENGGVVLDAEQRVVLVDLLGEVVGLGQSDESHRRVVGQVVGAAHVGRLDDVSVLAE